jgi:hypothetical protein
VSPREVSGVGAAEAGEAVDRLDWPKDGLRPWQRRVAWAVAEALLCDEDDAGALLPASPEACARAVAWMNHSLGRASSDLRRGFFALSLLMELLPLFVLGTPRRMSRLPLARRVAYLEALEASRLSALPLLVVAFKVPLCVPAFEEGEELASTGFDRPTTAARRLKLARAPEAAP